uniref:Uncharacterized protein n=1 Tax=Trichobilharzia regenti TaxID=157069 RepID=A0AA85ITD8_TRIRE|nr:unnamed protein product [Trichobilharzia regenti]
MNCEYFEVLLIIYGRVVSWFSWLSKRFENIHFTCLQNCIQTRNGHSVTTEDNGQFYCFEIMRSAIWIYILAYCLYCLTMIEAGRKVIFRGPQSYSGYRGSGGGEVRHAGPAARRVDISNVQLYGARKNDATYREGLQELAGLM